MSAIIPLHNNNQNPSSPKENTTTTHPILAVSHPSLSPSPAATPACSACKYQRRRCTSECKLAPYFPAENPQIFLNAHRLFGVSNILKTLKNVDSDRRNEAMRTIIFQSNARAADPVGGCYKIVLELQSEINATYAELLKVRTLADYYRSKFEASISNIAPVPHINPVDMHSHNLLLSPAAADVPDLVPAAVQQQCYNHIYYDGQEGHQGSGNGNAYDQHLHSSYGAGDVGLQGLDQPMQMLSFRQNAAAGEVDVKPFVEIFSAPPNALAVNDDDWELSKNNSYTVNQHFQS